MAGLQGGCCFYTENLISWGMADWIEYVIKAVLISLIIWGIGFVRRIIWSFRSGYNDCSETNIFPWYGYLALMTFLFLIGYAVVTGTLDLLV